MAKSNFTPIGVLAVTTVILALFAGCSVGPDYVRPVLKPPQNYKEIDGWRMAQPQDNIIRGPWWEIFNEPELNALEEQVDVSNQNIVAAEANFREAQALVREARANYFPTITIGVGVTNSSRSTTITSGSSGGRSSSTSTTTGGASSVRTAPTQYSLPIDVSWELDVWGRIRRQVESSQAGAQASAADLQNAKLSAQTQLAQDYFQLRALDAEKRLLDDTAADYQKSVELTRNQYAAGIVSRADVLQAETQLKTTQAQAIDTGVQRAQVEHAIALLIGKTPGEVSVSVLPLSTQPPPVPVGLPSELLERRPDIAAAERRVAQANALIGVAEAAYFPTVSLGASGGFESTSLGKWISAPSRFWSVGPTITETVFDGGKRAAQTDQARATYDSSVALYRETVLTGFQQVEDNIAALRILENEAQVQDEAVKSAQQTVTIVNNQYRAGIVNYLNVVVVQAAALSNERTAINILGNRLNATVLLIKALGGGWNASQLP